MDFLNAIVLFANFVGVPALAYGSQLALGALGVTLVYSILRFSNFAHGEIMSFGTMVAILVMWMFQSAGIVPKDNGRAGQIQHRLRQRHHVAGIADVWKNHSIVHRRGVLKLNLGRLNPIGSLQLCKLLLSVGQHDEEELRSFHHR